ncbi:NAD(P)/FAD-dependent oxidoreductase [Nitrospira sp. Nam80]
MQTRIGIIGGGIMGLALAHRLSAKRLQVTVFERDQQLGGLSTYHNYGAFHWDRFYHVILPSDTHLIRFLEEIGLKDQLRWNPTRTGLYVDRRFYSLSNTMELLRFPLVGLAGKVRLALAVLRCLRIRDWKALEGITVEAWLTKLCGRRTYEVFWKPLLLAKLGEHYKRVSAVFIWTYITRLFSARDTAAQREHLGHVSGGYQTVIGRLEQLIRSHGGEIRQVAAVNAIRPRPEGGLWIDCDGRRESFDKVVCTSPVDVLQRLAGDDLLRVAASGTKVEYLGVVCLVLITRRPITPYYVLNIADSRVAFTGVIGMSTVVSPEETAGLYITYFPKYVLSDDPILRETEDVLRKRFLQGVTLMYPDLAEQDIVGAHINRAVRVQPLQVVNYSMIVPQVTTQHDDFYVLNTSQFVNATLNNNEVIRAVDNFLAKYGAGLERSREVIPPLAVSMG